MPIFKNDQRQQQFKRMGNIQNKIANGNTNPNLQGKYDRIQTQLQPYAQKRLDGGKLSTGQTNKLQNRMGMAPTTSAPVTDTTTTTTTTPAPGAQVAPGATNNPNWQSMFQAMFPQTGGMDANIDINAIQENPYYKHQQQKGETALTRYNASRGLIDSKADEQAMMDFNGQLLGNEVQQRRDYQQREADRAQGNAGRLFNLIDSEANRGQTNSQNQFRNQLDLYKAMSSNSPLEYGYGAANTASGLQSAYGKDKAGYAAQNYSRPSAGGYQSPFPTGPDYSGANMWRTGQQAGQGNSADANNFDFWGGMMNAFGMNN